MRKFQAGETLTPEEQAYLERVNQESRKRAAGKRRGPAPNVPERKSVVNTSDWRALVPIDDMNGPYEGGDGGLYSGGGNERDLVDQRVPLLVSRDSRLGLDGRPHVRRLSRKELPAALGLPGSPPIPW